MILDSGHRDKDGEQEQASLHERLQRARKPECTSYLKEKLHGKKSKKINKLFLKVLGHNKQKLRKVLSS